MVDFIETFNDDYHHSCAPRGSPPMTIRAIQIASGLGAGNIGDEFMMRAFWDVLPSNVRVRIEHFGLYPRHSKSYPPRHEYDVVSMSAEPPRIPYHAPGLIVGATPVSESLGVEWPLGFIAPRLAAFASRRLPVDALGVGVEPLSSPEAVSIFKKHFLPIRSWTVRSNSCRDALRELGVPSDRIVVGADWAWLYASLSDERASAAELWRGLGIDLGRALIVVNVTDDAVRFRDERHSGLAAALDRLRTDHGFQIAFFANDIRSGYDVDAIERIRARMREPGVVVPQNPYHPDELLGILSHATLTLGNRYHFIVASVLAGAPPIGFALSPKIGSLLDDLGLVPVGNEYSPGFSDIITSALAAASGRSEIMKRLVERRSVLSDRARRNLEFFIRYYGEHPDEKLKRIASVSRGVALPPLDRFHKILIPRFDALGDLVLLEGFLEALLSRISPEAEVTMLVRRGLEFLAPLFPQRLRWIPIDIEPYRHPAPQDQLDRVKERVADREDDLVIMTTYSRTWADDAIEGVLSRRGAANILPLVLSLSRNERDAGMLVDVDVESHELKKYETLWRALSNSDVAPSNPRLRVPDDVAAEAEKLLGELGLAERDFIVCCPAGVTNVRGKVWPAEAFAECVARIEKNYGLPSLVIGLESEEEVVETVYRRAGAESAEARTWISRPEDLPLLAALLKRARLYLGNDTGPMHMAAALGVPVAAIFGGGTWPRFIPPSAAISIVHTLPCFGCGWSCRFDHPLCMKLVGVNAVMAEIDRACTRKTGFEESEIVDLRKPDAVFPSETGALLRELARRVAIESPAFIDANAPPFRQLAALDNIPKGLDARGVHYRGVDADGWVGASATVQLDQLSRLERLRICGMVPLVHDAEFTTEMLLFVDGVEMAKQSLGIGSFEFCVMVPIENRTRMVELRFSRLQKLKAPDEREASILLTNVGFEENS